MVTVKDFVSIVRDKEDHKALIKVQLNENNRTAGVKKNLVDTPDDYGDRVIKEVYPNKKASTIEWTIVVYQEGKEPQ